MNSGGESVAEAGIAFFGTMTASISHEIKNVLAIINENAGLLEDLVLRAEQGMPVENDRFRTLSTRITNQVRRAEGIVKTLNAFAHSADRSGAADLNEVVRLAGGLFARPAAMRGCKLETAGAPDPVPVPGSPFHLTALLWRCVDAALACAGGAETIRLAAKKSAAGASVIVSGLRGLPPAGGAPFPEKQDRGLLDRLGAEVIQKTEAGEIAVVFPGGGARRGA